MRLVIMMRVGEATPKKQDFWGIFPKGRGGLPNSQNLCLKKWPLKHPKIIQKTIKFSKSPPLSDANQKKQTVFLGIFSQKGGRGGSDTWEKFPKNPVFFWVASPRRLWLCAPPRGLLQPK